MQFGMSQTPASQGDVIVIDAFSEHDTDKVELLVRLMFSSPALSLKSDQRPSRISGISLLINMRSIEDLSPSTIARVTPTLFCESVLASDHLASFIVPRLASHWTHPQWIFVLQSRLTYLQENMVEHCTNFLKKNNSSEALVHWSGDRQFCNSLSYKVIALLRELEVEYPLEGSQPIKNRQTAIEFRREVDCCILFALFTEIENHLKNFMLVSTSKFIIDTIRAYILPEVEEKQSEESSQQSSDEMESEYEDKENNILKILMDQLKVTNKYTIFSYCYIVKHKTWKLWSTQQRKDLLAYEQKEVSSRVFDPNSVTQQEKPRTSKPRTSITASLVSARKSFQTMSQGSVRKKKSHNPALKDTFKIEFWANLLSKYGNIYVNTGLPLIYFFNSKHVANQISTSFCHSIKNRKMAFMNINAELLFNKATINSFTRSGLSNVQSPIVCNQ